MVFSVKEYGVLLIVSCGQCPVNPNGGRACVMAPWADVQAWNPHAVLLLYGQMCAKAGA